MLSQIKSLLYFPIARYFRYFAAIKLRRWKPRIVVVTGSNGKTTLLHLLEAQIGNSARYSHHANSSYGVPFDILGLYRKSLFKSEWIWLFLLAPFKAFTSFYKEMIYIVEADADRAGEGEFLAKFLKPEVVLWVSTAKTHSMGFEKLVRQKKFQNVEDAIAYEFGFFLEYCQKLAIIDGDLPLSVKQIKRSKAEIKEITKRKYLQRYEVSKTGAKFKMEDVNYSFKGLLPQEVFYSIAMCKKTVEYLGLPFDKTFSKFVLPPGRSSIFQGIKDITIIDSSYNASLSSMESILKMYDKYPGDKKWIVLGDMLEQGESEKEEHEKLAKLIDSYKYERIILMGPRVSRYTFPKLAKSEERRAKSYKIEKFEGPKETLEYLLQNLRGGETILFKGARFMEGIIENLLLDKKDVAKLARREMVWERRRKEWGL